MKRFLLVMLWILAGGLPLYAQQPDDVTVAPIVGGSLVQDEISTAAFYDWWYLDANVGDTLRITMTPLEQTLAPLIGVLSPTRNLVGRSEDGQLGQALVYNHPVEEAGEYIIVATRVGNANGTSVGMYTLQVEIIAPSAPATPDPFREVTFVCNSTDAANLLTLGIQDDPEQSETVSVSVYGLDGLVPVLRSTLVFDFEPFRDQFCIDALGGRGAGYGEGDMLQLAGSDALLIGTGQTAKTNYQQASAFGLLRLNVGSLERSTGRYVVVIDGLHIGRDGDSDIFELGLGALAQASEVYVYAVADKRTRLDVSVRLLDDGFNPLADCDDAALRECADTPPINGFAWYSAEFDRRIEGGRFDAGVPLVTGSTARQLVAVRGYEGRTYGSYSLVIIGEFDGG